MSEHQPLRAGLEDARPRAGRAALAPARRRGRRARRPRRRCSRRPTCAVAARSTGSRCRSAPVRSSGWPACSGRAAPRRRAPSSARTRSTPARSRVDGTPLQPHVAARRGQAQDRLLVRRTARPRASSPQLSVRENLTLALLPRLRRHGIVDRKRQPEIVDRFIKAIGDQVLEPGPADPRALRRQPAEGAAGPLAVHRPRAADPRRADPRHRRRRQAGHPGPGAASSPTTGWRCC